MVGLLALSWALDVATFASGPLLRGGVWADGNPIADALWTAGGLLGIVWLKACALLVVMLLVVWRVAPERRRRSYCFAAWFGVVGAMSNLPGLAGVLVR